MRYTFKKITREFTMFYNNIWLSQKHLGSCIKTVCIGASSDYQVADAEILAFDGSLVKFRIINCLKDSGEIFTTKLDGSIAKSHDPMFQGTSWISFLFYDSIDSMRGEPILKSLSSAILKELLEV